MKLKSDHIPDVVDDLLGRNNIATEIVNGLVSYSKKNKDGLTISITGEWGSGKSTLVDYIRKQIEEKEGERFKIVLFNPWLFYKDESIKEAFLIHLALSLKDLETRTTQVSEKLNDFIKAFRWLKYLSGTAGKIQEGLENLSEQLGKKNNIFEIRNEIEEILKKNKKKIIVLIDDVDRLSADQIAELFQTITLVTNFSNIIYLVAFDRQIVIDAIGKNFNGKGQEYLEKVIQVDYEIPSIQDKKLEDLFYSNIQELGKENKLTFDEYALKSLWGYHGLKDYFKSIRDFKRFFNGLSFRLPSIAGDINPVDFLTIEAIRIFDYPSYTKFYTYYKINARKRELPEAGLNTEQFELLSPASSEIIKALASNSSLHPYRKESNMKRLLDPEYFDRYFNLLRNDSDISEKELQEIITRPTLRKRILQEALQYNRIENLINRLKDRSLHKIYKNYDYDLIRDIIEFFNANSSIFEAQSDQASDMLINLITGNRKNRDEFIRTFFQSFRNRASPPSIVHIYFFHYIRLFVKEDRHFRSDYQIFDDYYKKHYSSLEKVYLPIFKNAANFMWESRQTQLCPFLKYLYLRNYSELMPDDYPGILTSFLNDKDFLVYIASQYVHVSKEDLSFHRYNWVFPNSLFPEGTFRDFYEAVKAIEPQSLNDYQRVVQHHLLALDITSFPNIKYPSEPRMIMV
ncbi:MAG: AAA family ATPase [Chitinophagales bacterium]|nr:AAA family ATPase [Chitinophagales bacterium]